MFQNISKYVFGQVLNYIMNGLWMKIWKVDIHGWTSSMLMFGDFFGSNVSNDVGGDVDNDVGSDVDDDNANNDVDDDAGDVIHDI